MRKRISVFVSICVTILFSMGCKENDIIVATNTLPTSTPAIIAITPTNSPGTNYFDQLSEGLVVAVVGRDYGALFLVETETEEHRKLEIPGEFGINIYGWSIDGCTLFVGTETNRIVQVDVEGNIKDEIVRIDDLDLDGNVVQTKISPDEKWVAFLSGTGNHEYASYEFQNLITVSVQDQGTKTYPLTNSGLVNDMAWEPARNLIAYNDSDVHDVQQIFISNPDGSERIQLTHFVEQGFIIRSLEWSPTGEKLAFAIVEEDTNESYLSIVNVPFENSLINIASIVDVNEFWWTSNDIVVADVSSLGKNPNIMTDRDISWYNATTGEELGSLDLTELPNGIFELPGPLAFSNTTGFFSGDGFYEYDLSSLQIERIFSKFSDIRNWISRPGVYDSEICTIKE